MIASATSRSAGPRARLMLGAKQSGFWSQHSCEPGVGMARDGCGGCHISPHFGGAALLGWPACSPVNASPTASRRPTHDSGPVWFATPSPYDSFIRCSHAGLYRRTECPLPVHSWLLGTNLRCIVDLNKRISVCHTQGIDLKHNHGGSSRNAHNDYPRQPQRQEYLHTDARIAIGLTSSVVGGHH